MIEGKMPADVPAEVLSATSGEAGTSLGRLASVDVLRGLVMVIMALDHTRDFFSNSANLFDPTDLAHTSPMLFFTRWITHFCAPVFVFLAGAGAYLSLTKGKDVCELSKFLITRGVWPIFLELFVILPLGWSSYAVLFAVEIEQRLVLAALRLGIFRNQPSTAVAVLSSRAVGSGISRVHERSP